MLTGVLFIVLGLIADQISQMRLSARNDNDHQFYIINADEYDKKK